MLGAVCGGALFRVADGMFETAVTQAGGASVEFFQVYSLGQRGTFLTCITLNTLSSPPPPQACTEDVIFQGPRWKTEPSDLILSINTPDQRATITCEAEGSPPLQYR